MAETIKPTRANLEEYGHAPLLRIMIAVALDGSTITYGEAARQLEKKVGFSKIFSTEMGYAVGTMMNRIQAATDDTPLLNVLMVAQKDGKPSQGAGSYMAERFEDPLLARANAKARYPRKWAAAFERAAQEVYQYSASEWADLFEQVFDVPLPLAEIEEEQKTRKQGSEQDGISRGRGGEGPNHKALRLWTMANPQSVRRSYADAKCRTEVDLDSGDRVDVVFYCPDRIVLLEVKSRDSNLCDLRRGIFQCIKYRAVRKAMDVRDDPTIDTILVTEEPLPGEIADLLRLHEIRHFQAPMDRP